jgi:adenylate kinase family enzyme
VKRILVIGSSGAGKSTFARRLHEATEIKLIHLDKIYWQPNWVEPSDKTVWGEGLKNYLQEDEWIIDGNYSGTLEMRMQFSDTVIFLDIPNYICVYRILKRTLLYRKRGRPDMAEGCRERLSWEFLRLTWNYPIRSKPKVEALLKRFENEKNIIRLKSNTEVENFFRTLENKL